MLYILLCFYFDENSKKMNLIRIDIVEYITMNLLNMKHTFDQYAHHKLNEYELVHCNLVVE